MGRSFSYCFRDLLVNVTLVFVFFGGYFEIVCSLYLNFGGWDRYVRFTLDFCLLCLSLKAYLDFGLRSIICARYLRRR